MFIWYQKVEFFAEISISASTMRAKNSRFYFFSHPCPGSQDDLLETVKTQTFLPLFIMVIPELLCNIIRHLIH